MSPVCKFLLSSQRCIAERVVQEQVWKSHCEVKDRPELGIIELELASLFGTGIAMSSWTWTSNTLQTWQKLWRRSVTKRKFRCICNDAIKLLRYQPGKKVSFCDK